MEKNTSDLLANVAQENPIVAEMIGKIARRKGDNKDGQDFVVNDLVVLYELLMLSQWKGKED